MDNEREHILFALSRALQEFTSASTSSRLIPEVGTNIGYAISNAASIEDVAAVPGRIRRAFGRAIYCLPPAFGASDHIARVILTAMKYDPKVRSAMNVKIVDPATIGAYVFDRSLEPTRSASKEGRTMNFMVESAYRSTGSVRGS